MNLLLIAYYFPPCTHVGAFRPASVAKYLARAGWDVTVLAATFPGSFEAGDGYRVVRVPAFDVLAPMKSASSTTSSSASPADVAAVTIENGLFPSRQAAGRLAKSILAFPDRHNGWLLRAAPVARRLVRQHRIEALLSTSSPQTSALLARRIAKEFDLPWVADFRDLWSQYQRYAYGRFRRALETRLERWTLSRADSLTTVTEPIAERWRTLHPQVPITVIPNSFDPELVPVRRTDGRRPLRITLTGKTLEGFQDPSILFNAIGRLRRSGRIDASDVVVRFRGSQFEWMRPLTERYGVTDLVEFLPPVPRVVALQEQVDSSLLLVLTWTDPNERGVLTGKLPEYLGAGVPIVAVGPFPDAVSRALDTTGAGTFFSEADSLAEYLAASIGCIDRGEPIPYGGIPERIEEYAAPKMAERFSRVLESAAIRHAKRSGNDLQRREVKR